MAFVPKAWTQLPDVSSTSLFDAAAVIDLETRLSHYTDVALAAGFAKRAVNVKDLGAVGNGSTDDSAAITAAITAVDAGGGGVVYFPAGTYITSTQTINSFTVFQGEGVAATTIKLKAGTNDDLLRTKDFSTLTGGSSTGGPTKFALRELTLDGNKANNSTGWPLRIYGSAYRIESVEVWNGKSGGIYSEWGSGGTDMEAFYSRFKIRDWAGPGTYGLYFAGPHDSIFHAGIVASLDSSITTGGSTTYGIYVAGGGAGTTGHAAGEIFSQVHVWGRAHYGWFTGGQVFCNGCIAEGAFTTNVLLGSPGCSWHGGAIYGTNGNSGQQPTEVGLEIGTGLGNVTRCTVNTVFFNFASGGFPIKFTATAGQNVIRATGVLGTSTAWYTGSVFTGSSGDWLELFAKDNLPLSVYHVPLLASFPSGVKLGNAASTNANTVLGGSAVPSNSTGANGDFYLRSDSLTWLYIKISGIWVDVLTATNASIATLNTIANANSTAIANSPVYKNAFIDLSAGFPATAVLQGDPNDCGVNVQGSSLVNFTVYYFGNASGGTLKIQSAADLTGTWTDEVSASPSGSGSLYTATATVVCSKRYVRFLFTNGGLDQAAGTGRVFTSMQSLTVTN